MQVTDDSLVFPVREGDRCWFRIVFQVQITHNNKDKDMLYTIRARTCTTAPNKTNAVTQVPGTRQVVQALQLQDDGENLSWILETEKATYHF